MGRRCGAVMVGVVVAAMVSGTGCAYRGDVKRTPLEMAEAEPAATVFGCYAYAHELGGIANWRTHVKLMKAYGMNTVAPFTTGPEDIAAQLDIMVEEGMLESSIPMFLLDHSVAEHFKQVVPNWDEVVKEDPNPLPGRGPAMEVGRAAVFEKAREIGKHSDRWPEFIAYSVDEPGRGKPMSDEEIEVLRKITARYNKVGIRCGTACIYPNVKNLSPVLDVIAWCAIYGGDLKGCRQAILGAGKEFWVYDTGTHRLNPKLARWWVGYWTWQMQPKARLVWNWNQFITGDMTDPQPTDVLRAFGEGVKDFKLLTAAENRLKPMLEKKKSARLREIENHFKALRAGFEWETMPQKEFNAARAEGKKWHEVVPELDMDALREMAEEVLAVR